MKTYCTLLLALLLFSACSEKLNFATLANTKWTLTEWPGHTLPATAKGTLEFRPNNAVGGKSFCNGYGGSYTLTGNKIQFGALMGTKMYCEEVGAAETDFLNAFAKANTIKITGQKLHLMQDANTLLIFSKAD